MAYWRLHYHLIWAAHKREPIITESREKIIYGTLYSKAKEIGVVIHAIGNMSDHIHVVASIPPKLSVADCIKHFKGATLHAINHTLPSASPFKWQAGYGALTLSSRSLATVVAYANNQKQHHRDNTLIALCERASDEDDGPQIQSFQD